MALFTITTVNAQFFDKALKKVKDKAKEKIESLGAGSPATQNAPAAAWPANEPLKSSAQNTEAMNEPTGIKAYSKYDFLPGDKAVYFENFEQAVLGELPPGWNSSGKGELVSLDKYPGKWLRLFPGTKYLSGNTATLGENYTIEFDLIFQGTPPAGTRFLPDLSFGLFASETKSPTDNVFLDSRVQVNNQATITLKPNVDEISRLRLICKGKENIQSYSSENQLIAPFGKSLNKVAHYAIQVQGQRLRLWVNEVKLLDMPKVINTNVPLNQLFFNPLEYWPYHDDNFGLYLSNLRIASGQPDNHTRLSTDGKFSTTGILFESGSSQIMPYSAAVLNEIATLLAEQPGLKLKIIGHTDQDGEASKNLELSRQRAAAVKTILVGDYKIDSSRLETGGEGERKPINPSLTAEAKAQNRRVEFIRI